MPAEESEKLIPPEVDDNELPKYKPVDAGAKPKSDFRMLYLSLALFIIAAILHLLGI